MALPNILEQFVSYNCLFTFSCASPAQLNSQSYRSGPLPNVIVSSGGRDDAARVQTAYGAPEYFIDNVSIANFVVPTNGTGSGPWSKLEFEIFEPYSMGLFLQSCQAAALESKYKSYLDNAAYVLRLEFVGWTAPGESMTVGPFNWLVRLMNANFTVNEAGSTYKVECFPYNHVALSQQMNKVFNDVKLVGKDSNEVLIDHPEYSLISFLNKRELQLVQDKKKTYPDKYNIAFVGDNPYGRKPGNDLEFTPESQGGTEKPKRAGDIYDDASGKIIRGKMSINPKEKSLQFSQDTSITNIIDQVILSTKEARDRATKEDLIDSQGRVTWWKTNVDVLLLEDKLDPKLNDYAKDITFRVQPYKIHHSAYLSPSGTSKGITACKSAAQKEYNYIYTGLNTDIIKFNIEIKHMLFTAIDPNKVEDSGGVQNNSVNQSKSGPTLTSKQSAGAPNPSVGGGAAPAKFDMATGNIPFKGGSGQTSTEQKIANEFYMAYLNSVGNQINLDLEILGDPYFLPEVGYSNFHSESEDQVTENGTMNHEATDIWVVVNFRTPADPDAGGAAAAKSGLYYFPEGQAPSPFSGLFKVTKVEARFKGNLFTQVVSGFRIPAQDQGDSSAGVFPTTTDKQEPDSGTYWNQPGE
jgi:hypothetical protein